jgi:hypothetical protein
LTAGDFGLVLVGKAQERTSSWRGFIDKARASHRPGHLHIVWRRQSSVADHWYFCFADDEWGPAFIKLCSYAAASEDRSRWASPRRATAFSTPRAPPTRSRTHDLLLVGLPETLHMSSRLAFFVAMTNMTNPDDE